MFQNKEAAAQEYLTGSKHPSHTNVYKKREPHEIASMAAVSKLPPATGASLLYINIKLYPLITHTRVYIYIYLYI